MKSREHTNSLSSVYTIISRIPSFSFCILDNTLPCPGPCVFARLRAVAVPASLGLIFRLEDSGGFSSSATFPICDLARRAVLRCSSSYIRSSSLLCSASDFSYACCQKETLSKNLFWRLTGWGSLAWAICDRIWRM